MDLTIDQRRALVNQFATAVQTVDLAGLEAAANPDITWTVPGASHISGQQHGVDGVLWLAKMFSDFGYQIALQGLTFGVNDVAVEIRGTGNHDGKTIDVAAVNVLNFRDGNVVDVGTHFSDIDSVDAYFA
jgi:ketosteroid isomerase-like protein